MLPDPLLVVKILVETWNALQIEYLIDGWVATSLYGMPDATNNVDFVADIKMEQVDPLVAALEGAFYVDGDMIRDAVETHSSFDVLHLPTVAKANVFLFQPTPWKQEEWARRRTEVVGTDDASVTMQVASPEDTVLQKLIWYRMGGGVSDRQWGDITGILKVQAEGLDYAYMRHWAAGLGLMELLQRTLQDAGNRE